MEKEPLRTGGNGENMKLIIYLFPAMINFIASGVFFYVTQRFVDAGASKLQTAMVVPAPPTTGWS